ncbi:Chaperone J-domain superfamily [Babesia duncani]|uniref:Chaperone J-domain superfamily n=1 Tax=Babesia duncani TaxID=323732 RepID=A0AAD9UQI8_9APIC|nr:Chaperone J-domain superfamily [Babesia duncani]
MIKKKLFKGGFKRKTLESSDEEEEEVITDHQDNLAFGDTTTFDGDHDSPLFEKRVQNNYNDKTGRIRNVNIPRQFLEAFLVDFNGEDLAAKRTVETIYRASGSFSYTYRSLEEAFESNDSILKPFFKAMACIADEVYLVERLHSSKSSNGAVDPVILTSLQALFQQRMKSVIDKVNIDPTLTGWKRLVASVKCFFSSGLAKEIKASSGSNGADDFNKNIEEIRSTISNLISVSEFQNSTKSKRKKLEMGPDNLQEWLSSMDEIANVFNFLRHCYQSLFDIVEKCQESDTLQRVIDTFETDLKLENNVDIVEKVEALQILMRDEARGCLSDQVMENDYVPARFADMIEQYQQEMQRKNQQSDELAKKLKQKRESVAYILQRVEECNKPNLAPCFNHPFYILGIPPKIATKEVLRRCGRKLKTLLHPDTEQDVNFKLLAERGFKEAADALEKATTLVENNVNTRGFRMGPAAPFASFIGLPLESEADAGGPNVDLRGNVATLAPTLMLVPRFDLRCDDSKTGSITVSMDPYDLFENGASQHLGRNKCMHVYLHRPVHGDEPVCLTVNADLICSTQKVSIPDSGKLRTVTAKFEAVQPMVIGSAWKYFVGVQISSDRGTSVISWKSIYIELVQKGRTANQLIKLLSTFEKAPFIDQILLDYKVQALRGNPNSKAEAEIFLIECSKLAMRWAEGN